LSQIKRVGYHLVLRRSRTGRGRNDARLAPDEDEVVFNKYSPSIFFGTPFEQFMRAREVRTILFTGISTE
jgi:nicotinamidase-related amidase